MRWQIPFFTIIIILIWWWAATIVARNENREQDIITVDYFLSNKIDSPIKVPYGDGIAPRRVWYTRAGKYEMYREDGDTMMVFVPKHICLCRCSQWR